MELEMDYYDLLEKTRIFGEKTLNNLTECDIDSYLLFLGFPKVPSIALRANREVENLIFMLSCKLIQECSNVMSNRKKGKKDLEGYHLRLFGYIMLNLSNKRKLSVHNPVFLKMIEVDRPELKIDLEPFQERLKNILYLSTSLYGNKDEITRDSNNQILFSYNELNEVTRILAGYIDIFKEFYKRIIKGDNTRLDNKRINNIIFITLKEILVLINVVKTNKKVVNDKLTNQLLVFIYYLYQYELDVISKKNVVEELEKNDSEEGLGEIEPKETIRIEEYVSLLGEMEINLLEIVHNPVQSTMLELLAIGKGNKGEDGTSNHKKDKKRKEETEEEQRERIYGTLLILPNVMKSVVNNSELTHSVLSRLRELMVVEESKVGFYKEYLEKDRLILIKSYYRILLVLKSNIFIKYSTDGTVVKIVNESLSFVISHMSILYNVCNSVYSLSNEKQGPLREQIQNSWNVLMVVSNIDLELIDSNLEKVFKLLYLDFKWYSTLSLSQKTILFLMNISKNFKKRDNDFGMVCKSRERGGVSKKELVKQEALDNNLPSDDFTRNLIGQYNSMNQLTTFFEYIDKYYREYKEGLDSYDDEVEEVDGGTRDEGEENDRKMEERNKLKRKMKEKSDKMSSPKRLKLTNNESRTSESNGIKEDEIINEGVEINYLNNYTVIRNIDQFNINNNEVIRAFKIFEKYEYEMYGIIIAYLSTLEFNIRNIRKVAEEFIRLYKKLDIKCDGQSLMLMSQVIVTIRKLLSYFDPPKTEESEDEEFVRSSCPNERKETSETKNEKELINKLLIIVKDVYIYIRDNHEKLLKSGRNDVTLSIIYHIMLLNNEKLRIDGEDYEGEEGLSKFGKKYNENDDDSENEEVESSKRVLNMDVNGILSRLLGSSDGSVYSFVAKNMKLFNNNGKVDEFIWKNLELTGEDKGENLNKKLSLIYFRRYLGIISTSESHPDEEELTYIPSSKDDLCKNVKVFLENIISIDNTEIVKNILSTIDKVYKRLKVSESRRTKGGEKKENEKEELVIIMKNNIESLIALLEMLLYILNYEASVNIKKCYRMIIGYKNNEEGGGSKKGVHRESTNIFDVITETKKIIIVNEYYSEENEKKVISLFVKYYYTFTICIIKYTNEERDSTSQKWNVDYKDEGKTNRNITIEFNDSNDGISTSNINMIINTNESNYGNATYDSNDTVVSDAMKIMSSGNRDNEDMTEIDVSAYPEDQSRRISTVKLYVNNLLKNYLKPFKVKRNVKEDKRSNWDLYFVYKYIDTMKINNYNNYCVELFRENEIMKEILILRQPVVNGKDSKENGGSRSLDNEILLLYENIQMISSKCVTNVVLWSMNSYNFEQKFEPGEEGVVVERKDGVKGDDIVHKLHVLLLKMVEALNSDNKYMVNLAKKNDELHQFLKNLLNYKIYLYNKLVNESINDLENSYEDNTGHEVNKYILLFMLINNYNKGKMKEELFNDVCELVRNKQKYIVEMIRKKSNCVCVDEEVVEKKVTVGNLEKKISDEILFNYLIVNKLYNINNKVIKKDTVELVQIILNVMSRTESGEEVTKLNHIMFKLINTLVSSNINKNISVVVYFYHQFNEMVMRRNSGFRDLIKFTNLMVNTNNYKYIRYQVPVILNILIQTHYYVATKPEIKLEEDGKDVKEANDKNKQMLKSNIIKCIVLCEDKIKESVYRTIKNNQIKVFYKAQFEQQK
ncbi:hypothetical protein MACJ_003292 [Theileria orientalis]|uniref:Uncharacterized protein n=1 Tax=Theileria orientalis TaxID=68886 RepID=A0A976QW09_THEOR|nr:hypothetical protein MACJ_003292 [Theileria orientalis]